MKSNAIFGLLAILSMFSTVSMAENDTSKKSLVKKLLNAKTTQIETSFAYYKNRSAESIASEIELNGFEAVYYFIINFENVNGEVVKELHKLNMPVAAMVLPTGVYISGDMLPAGWEKWRMEFTTNELDQYIFLSFIYDDYREWIKSELVELSKAHQFEGFTFAEAMYPICDGPERKNVLYGDISPRFQEAFKKDTGNSAFPNFTNQDDPNYFKTNKKLYNELVEYRVKSVDEFYHEIVNGKNGLRDNYPDMVFASWTLGINIPDGVAKLREWEGNDIYSMIKLVKPDIHFIQTHYPDWSNANLPPDYVKQYKPFFDEIRRADKNVKIGLQTDVGSYGEMRRDNAWLKKFYAASRQQGVDTTTYYEFHLRWEIYAEAPVLKKATASDDKKIKLYFDQRIADKCSEIMIGRKIVDSKGQEITIVNAKVDGNILIADVDKTPKTGTVISVPVGGICDDPDFRIARSHKAPMPFGPVNSIPADKIVKMRIASK